MEKFYPQHAEEFSAILDDLKGKKVAVISHLRPDGDCIGAQVAFCRLLHHLGIEAVAINPDPVPRILEVFLGGTPILLPDQFTDTDCVAVFIDCAEAVRAGRLLLERFPKVFINIDHHISNDNYGEHNFVHTESSATSEILAGLLLDNDMPLDSVMAQALYIGIATDTGQFRFPSTTKQVFEIVRRLVEHGADPAKAAIELYERTSIAKLDLLRHFLASLKLECGGRVCIGLLPRGIYEKTGASNEDSEGLVDYARAIEGVEIGILLEERDGAVKGSFRAKDAVHRVDLLARQFNGGGHACASGFNLTEPIDTFYPRLINSLDNHFKTISES